MKTIAITLPDFFPDEVEAINRMFAEGAIDLLHIRKPGSTIDKCRQLLDNIRNEYYGRIVVNDHFALCAEYNLYGVHLNRRNPTPPPCHQGSISCSCHSLKEVVARKLKMNYVFLSPIFDSISKQGYRSAFDDATLKKASAEGIIDQKVVALGGVTRERMAQLQEYGFGGAAMLGDIWR